MPEKQEITLTILKEIRELVEEMCQIWFLGEYDPAVNRIGKKANKLVKKIGLVNNYEDMPWCYGLG